MSSASVILVGPMGSGKSTIGRALADREQMNHLDIDEMIVQADGRTIPEIFEAEGESGFRILEHGALTGTLTGGPAVVSTGAASPTGNYCADPALWSYGWMLRWKCWLAGSATAQPGHCWSATML